MDATPFPISAVWVIIPVKKGNINRFIKNQKNLKKMLAFLGKVWYHI
jgi:hypothetical protein